MLASPQQSKQFDLGNSTFYKMKKYKDLQDQILEKWRGVKFEYPQQQQPQQQSYRQVKNKSKVFQSKQFEPPVYNPKESQYQQYPELASEYKSKYGQYLLSQPESYYTLQQTQKKQNGASQSIGEIVQKTNTIQDHQNFPQIEPMTSQQMINISANPSSKFQNNAQQILSQPAAKSIEQQLLETRNKYQSSGRQAAYFRDLNKYY